MGAGLAPAFRALRQQHVVAEEVHPDGEGQCRPRAATVVPCDPAEAFDGSKINP